MNEIIDQVWTGVQTHWPTALAALVIIVVTFIIAKLVSWGLRSGIDRLNLETVQPGESPALGKSVGMAGFWTVILIGLVATLEKLGLNQVTEPLNTLLNQIMAFIPSIFAAALLMTIFSVVAYVVRRTLSSVLTFADPLPQKFGLASGPVNISGITSIVAFSLLILVGLSVSLDALQLESISGPVGGLIDSILGAVPDVVVALIVLALFVFIGQFVANLIESTLPNTGIDKAIGELGLLKGADSELTASKIISKVSLFFIILIGLVQAIDLLNFEVLSEYMDVVLSMGAKIVFGSLIVFAGIFLANIISGAMASAGSGATDLVANIVKWVIITLAAIMGVSRMGLDPEGGLFVLDITKLLAMGAAVGLAGAITIGFGWGGRDWFAAQLENWKKSK